MGSHWDTLDPFIFTAYHRDVFPPADGPTPGTLSSQHLVGRNIGSDFVLRNNFRMYHGERGVPGFPAHPHYGFETITVITEGLCDHHDSLGATARFGGGGSDTQWVTTAAGMQHAEMFPLVHKDKPNPLELFQIWINLPSASKRKQPYFTMLWSEKNPVIELANAKITVIADAAHEFLPPGQSAQPPPPDSWAANADSRVALLLIDLEAGGKYELPATLPGVNRKIFFFSGTAPIDVASETLAPNQCAELDGTVATTLSAVATSRLMLMQGRPIGEPVVHRGPFVANSQQELLEVFQRFSRTQFGGWPWPRSDPSHALKESRFARHPDGRIERPGFLPVAEAVEQYMQQLGLKPASNAEIKANIRKWPALRELADRIPDDPPEGAAADPSQPIVKLYYHNQTQK